MISDISDSIDVERLKTDGALELRLRERLRLRHRVLVVGVVLLISVVLVAVLLAQTRFKEYGAFLAYLCAGLMVALGVYAFWNFSPSCPQCGLRMRAFSRRPTRGPDWEEMVICAPCGIKARTGMRHD